MIGDLITHRHYYPGRQWTDACRAADECTFDRVDIDTEMEYTGTGRWLMSLRGQDPAFTRWIATPHPVALAEVA